MTKTPPPSEELIRQLSDYDLRVGELALALRAIVLEEAPAVVESIFRSYALAIWYSFSGRMSDSFCYIGVSTGHVNLGFYRGTELRDPGGVLEGAGKQMRHIKIRRFEDLNKPHLRRFIRDAMKQATSTVRDSARPIKSPARPAGKRKPAK